MTSVEHGPADEAIVDYVTANDVDLNVMGTHGCQGAERQRLRGMTERVNRTSPDPVLEVRMA